MIHSVGVTATRRSLTVQQEVVGRAFLSDLWRQGARHFHYGYCDGGDEQLARLARWCGYVLFAHPQTNTRWEHPDPIEPDFMLDTLPPLVRNKVIVVRSDILLAGPRQTPEDEPQRGTRGEGTWWTIHCALDHKRPVEIVGRMEQSKGEPEMLGKKKQPQETVVRTVVELSPEARQALIQNDNDMQVLGELLTEVVANQRTIIASLHGDILQQSEALVDMVVDQEVPFTRSGRSGIGVRVFEESEPLYEGMSLAVPSGISGLVKDDDLEEGRVRRSPFNRVPRHKQEAWLLDYLTKNPGWVHGHEIADQFAGDEREKRYLKSAISRTLKELYDQGKVEREDATQRGSMFRYRLKGA